MNRKLGFATIPKMSGIVLTARGQSRIVRPQFKNRWITVTRKSFIDDMILGGKFVTF